MIKKILIIIVLFLTSCGYEVLYKENKTNELSFKKIELSGNIDANRRLISALSIKENNQNYLYDKLILNSKKSIVETSKNSKGQVSSFRMSFEINVTFMQKSGELIKKVFSEDFVYNNLDNKYDLNELEREIENNLLDKIIDKFILYIHL